MVPLALFQDRDLKEAVYQGVGSVVLKGEIPLRDRETISKLLNSKREFKWWGHPKEQDGYLGWSKKTHSAIYFRNVNSDGSLNITDAFEDTTTCKQFEAMSKVLDAGEPKNRFPAFEVGWLPWNNKTTAGGSL